MEESAVKITSYQKEERWTEPWVWREMMQLVGKVSGLLFKNVSPHFSYAECEIVLDLVKESIQKFMIQVISLKLWRSKDQLTNSSISRR